MSEDSPGPGRWPASVYGHGEEPDPRFSFANERTFLAWLRTALALLAGGVALDAVTLQMDSRIQQALAVLLILLGCGAAAGAWLRWSANERAMRQRRPLPGVGVSAPLALAVVLVGLVLISAIFLA